ncbi:MAG: hypothetical protein IJS21_04235 [Deltaproteobacteria bacterium]|nr:hypothetical protein [Deltaproteobacteria bacterium]
MNNRRMLIITDDDGLAELLARKLAMHEMDSTLSSMQEAPQHVMEENHLAMLVDARDAAPGHLSRLRSLCAGLPLVALLSAADRVQDAFAQGADDCLSLPPANEEVETMLCRVQRLRALYANSSPARIPAPSQEIALEQMVNEKLRDTFAIMNLATITSLHDIVMRQIERPLIQIVLEKTRGNQIRAAEILGINRNTLRKKMQLLEITVKK